MAQSWTGKIKDAVEGMVDGSDVLARLVSTAQLSGFRQELADRRLDAEIATVNEPWRVPFVLGPLAAPFWLAESLVTVARSLADAEAAAHPDRKTSVSWLTHGQLVVLLEPVEMLQSEISGLLADPHRRSQIVLPMAARIYARSDAGLRAERVTAAYVRGLLAGATSVAGSGQLLAEDYRAFFEHATAPDWLKRAFSGILGDLAVAQSRLDAGEARTTALLHAQAPEEAALQDLAAELWGVTNTLLIGGQLLAAPSLLPGASQQLLTAVPPSGTRVLSAQIATSTAPPSGAVAPARPADVAATPDRPPEPVQEEPPRAMPEIEIRPVAMPSPPAAKEAAVARHEAPRGMPEIGNLAGPSSPQPPRSASAPAGKQDAAVQPDESRALPRIGAAARANADRPLPAIGADPRAVPVDGARSVKKETESSVSSATGAGAPESLATLAGPPQPRAESGHASSAMASVPVSSEPVPLPGRRVDRKDRWILSGIGARHRLRDAGLEDEAERELAVFWDVKHWSLTAQEATYLDELAVHVAGGTAALTGRSLATCPYPPVSRVTGGSIRLLGQPLMAGTVFTYEHQPGGRGLVTELPAGYGVPDKP